MTNIHVKHVLMLCRNYSSQNWIFLQIFKVAQKSGQTPWAIVQGISSKMAPREFSIFIFFPDAYTCCYVA